jgi:uncharacterized membrane protein
MTWQVLAAWVVRLLHIGSAIGLVGGPLYVRMALLPATGRTLDEGTDLKLRQAVNARWKVAVYALVALLILTGTFNFLVPLRGPSGNLITARWREFGEADRQLYHMVFGVKVLAAFGIFFLASALAGESAVFAPIRKHARTSVTLLLLMAGLLVACSTMLRQLPLHGTVATGP